MRIRAVAFVLCGALARSAKGDALPELPLPVSFAIAGLSGMTAWLVIHPGDLVKTRMIMADEKAPKESAMRVARRVVREDGAGALYAGLSAALARQALYTTLRLGLYDVFKVWLALALFRDGPPAGSAATALRLLAGVLSGGAASLANCPIEVALVKMQADGRLPPSKRHNYKGLVDVLKRVARDDGILSYWSGAAVTVIRAMVVSVSQVSTYDQAKASLSRLMQAGSAQFLAAVISALVFTICSMPFETIKTRIQGQDASKVVVAGGKAPYKGVFASLVRVSREEGLLALWRGYAPYLVSKGVLTVLLFTIKEQYTELAGALLRSWDHKAAFA